MADVPSVVLPGSGRSTSRLGFGCGTLMRIPRSEDRDAVLRAAYEAGIRHFDVARSYGLGRAESELGRFLETAGGDVTVATKFGIDVGANAAVAGAQSLLRRLIALHPAIRAAARKVAGRGTARRDFSVTTARASIERSLAELGVGRVDLLFLHEPALADLEDPALLSLLEERRAAGDCAAFGISSNGDEAVRIAETYPALGRVIQIRFDATARRLDSVKRAKPDLLATFGALQRALPLARRWLDAAPEVASRWSRMLGLDLRVPEHLAGALLACSEAESGGGLVLFSTTRPERIPPTVRAFSTLVPARDELLELGSLLRAALPSA